MLGEKNNVPPDAILSIQITRRGTPPVYIAFTRVDNPGKVS